MAKVFPFLNDATSADYAAVQSVIQRFPVIRSLPNPVYAAMAYLEGDRSLRAKVAARGRRMAPLNGGQRRLNAPGSGGGGAVPPRTGTVKAKLDAARQAVLKSGSQGALASFLETAGWVK